MTEATLSKRDRGALARDRLNLRYGLARTVVIATAFVFGFYMIRDPLAALAGKNTNVSVALSFLADFKVVLSFTLTGFASLWALGERRLRYRKVENLQGRIKELEQRLDPKRSSTHLTAQGKTNPRDRT